MVVSRRALATHAAIFSLFAGLTILVLWPVARDLDSTIAGWEGDNLFCIRQMWWVKHAIVDLGQSPFFDRTAYYPSGYDVAHGPILAANTIGGLPFTLLFGPVVSYNLMILLSFVLTGFGVSLWVGRLTGSRAAGVLAGIIAAFLPYRLAHLVGHMHMMTTQWIAFALYAFERFRDAPGTREGLFLGAMLALVALSDWYYAYATGLMLPLYALARTRPWPAFWTRPGVWRGVAIAGVLSLALVLPFLIPYVRLASEGGMTRSFGELEFWSLNFYDFFTPSKIHPNWGRAIAPWFPRQATFWVEQNVMLGYVALAVALVGVAFRRRHPAIAPLALVWIASYLIALGPTLHSGDRQVLLPAPVPVTQSVVRLLSLFPSMADMRTSIDASQAIPIPLPSLLLYLLVPGTAGMRVMARFGVWTGFMTAALAGFGMAVTLQWLERHGIRRPLRAAAVAAASALVLFESWPAFEKQFWPDGATTMMTMTVEPRPVDRWLARQPEDTAVIELPLEQGSRPLQDYYQTVHGRHWVMGPNFAYTPRVRVERQSILSQFPAPETIDALRSWKTTYVLFTPSAIPAWDDLRAAVEATGALQREGIVGEVWVYRLR